MDSTAEIDYKSIPSNPLKDLIAFEERIQHNMNSLKRLRFQALMRIVLALLGCFILLYFYTYKWPRFLQSFPWLNGLCLTGSGFFALMAVFFIIHTLYTRRLTLFNRYHAQCRKLLRIYNLDLRTGFDPKHLFSLQNSQAHSDSNSNSNSQPQSNAGDAATAGLLQLKSYGQVIKSHESMMRNGCFLTVKRRIAGRAHDLLDAYRIEYWRRKLKKK